MSRLCAVLPWLALVACASRTLPESAPTGSALAFDGAPAPPADVTRALRSDPPLPGEASAGWPGLGADAPTGEHAHSAHAHDHGQGAAPKDAGARDAAERGHVHVH